MWVPEPVQRLDESLLLWARGTPSLAVTAFYVLTVIGGGWGLLTFLPFLTRKTTRPQTLRLLGAIVTTSILVAGLKQLFARIRPCNALGWCAPLAGSAPTDPSFPSGHAAGAFTFATFVALRIPRYRIPALLFAALVAWSRCVLGVHYPSDVLAGAVLGGVVGSLAASVDARRESTTSSRTGS